LTSRSSARSNYCIDQEGMELANETEAARRGRGIAKSDALKGIPLAGGLIIVDDEWDNSVVDIPLAGSWLASG
jgi:hypothetical protein